MNEQEVDRIIRDWSSGHDVWQGDTSWMGEKWEEALVYPPSALTKKPGSNYRSLPEYHADEARKYISTIAQRWPLQVRILLALPLWLRFCEVWHMTGDRKKAMRAI